MRTSMLRSLSLLALATAALSASAQNLVTNASFETGDFAGWSGSSPSDLTRVEDATQNGGLFQARTGDHMAVFGDGTPYTVFQSLATTSGTSYDLTFWLRNRRPDRTLRPGDFFQASIGATTLLNQTTVLNDYTSFTYSFTATGSSTPLAFTATNGPDFWELDDVSVTAQEAPAVPGPLAALPFALMALNRRRKRA